MLAAPQWSVGPFRLDPETSCLWHGTQEVSLKPRALRCCTTWRCMPARLAAKDAPFRAIWPNVAVGATPC
jgi:hypothetical protein